MSSPLRKITQAELEEHNEHNSTAQWLAVNGKVIDITHYKHQHPGGEDILLENAGTDSTESFENVGHGPDAREKLKSLIIGEITDYQPKAKATSAPKTSEPLQRDASAGAGGFNVITNLVVPGAIMAVIAYVVKSYFF